MRLRGGGEKEQGKGQDLHNDQVTTEHQERAKELTFMAVLARSTLMTVLTLHGFTPQPGEVTLKE